MHRVFILPLLLLLTTAAQAQSIFAHVPDDINPKKFYMFYIPDDVVTGEDMQPVDPQYGKYDYAGIVNRFAAEGFTVISYPREKDTHPYLFADETVKEIQKLLDAGVPASHISIVGARVGGGIAVIITSKLRNPEIQVVLLATCTEVFTAYWKEHEEYLSGNVLSIYHPGTDRTSCRDYLELCLKHGVRRYYEIQMPENAAKGFFYRATADWVLPAMLWSSGKHDMISR
ncbi:hypothetical protein KQI65_00705 [bacterium]|nr:hypothetical protein [bacterium]